jgi:acyl-CoA reductase-like NAD-dependent aldehyde dehydrogenase
LFGLQGRQASIDRFPVSIPPSLAYCFAMTLNEQMTLLAKQARAASRELAKLSTAQKNACLLAMADALEKNSASISPPPCSTG